MASDRYLLTLILVTYVEKKLRALILYEKAQKLHFRFITCLS